MVSSEGCCWLKLTKSRIPAGRLHMAESQEAGVGCILGKC